MTNQIVEGGRRTFRIFKNQFLISDETARKGIVQIAVSNLNIEIKCRYLKVLKLSKVTEITEKTLSFKC